MVGGGYASAVSLRTAIMEGNGDERRKEGSGVCVCVFVFGKTVIVVEVCVFACV